MTKLFALSAFALAVLSAQGTTRNPGAQAGPDVSGRWNRESTTGGVDRTGSGWGSRVQIDQIGPVVTVKPDSGRPERLRLDGVETAEALSVDGCKNKTRVTKATVGPDRLTITTWLVTKLQCFHGEDEDDPLINHVGAVEATDVRGQRRLESITVVYRDGNALTVERTTSAGTGDLPTTTTTTYRK